MTTRNRTGRNERRRSARGQTHRPNLHRFYRGELAVIVPGAFEFRLDLIRPGFKPQQLDALVEGFDWADEGTVLEGSVQLRRPDPDHPSSLQVARGDRIRCRTRWAGRWYEVWLMRVGHPEVDAVEGVVTVPLSDDLEALRRGRRDWVFRKTKRRGRGYHAHDVAKEVCRRCHVRPGRIVAGTKRFDKLVRRDSTGLAVLKEAYGKERDATHRRFVIRMRNGRLDVVPYRRNRILYVIRGELEAAVLSQEGNERPVTVIRAKGRIGKGKGAKKVETAVFDRGVVRRLGRIEDTRDYGRVTSRAALREKARLDLAKAIRVTRSAELTIPGVPFIHRGDGERWVTSEPGWHGSSRGSRDRGFVYVTGIRHTVGSGGEYGSTLTVVQEDPFVKDRERLDRELREARKKRKKK